MHLLISLTSKSLRSLLLAANGSGQLSPAAAEPAGQHRTGAEREAGEAQITDNKGQHYTATDAEEMIGKLTGMPIPLNSLRQWILGLPGDATDYTLDDQYRLSRKLHSGR